MGLPDSYTLKPNAVPAYFDAILSAQPPERFSVKFLEHLGFTSTNDRLFIGILKDLGFLNRDGGPQPRYFEFLDRTRAKQVVAEGIREGFSDLFAINTKAQELPLQEVTKQASDHVCGQEDQSCDRKDCEDFQGAVRLRRFFYASAPEEAADRGGFVSAR